MSTIPVTLSMTAAQHQVLMRHVFPADGLEAVAIALCGRASSSNRHRLLVRKLALVPYEMCTVRAPDRVTWPTSVLVPLLELAAKHNWAIVKVHGHRGYDKFSDTDDFADRDLLPSVYSWLESDDPHGSAIVMDDGRVFGRVVDEGGRFHAFEQVCVIGDDIRFFGVSRESPSDVPEYGRRLSQAFGKGTFELLRSLKVAVIGCSGTGSPVIEQLARNCVGTLVLVDPDHIEEKNLNRILNSTMEDAIARRQKVDVARRSIEAMGLGTEVRVYRQSLFNREVIQDVASCDVIFGCMDSIDGRFLLNKLASFYLVPYFDLGVKIEADGEGGVDQVAGSVHYLRPDGSSLLSRHVFSLEDVRAAGIRRASPSEYKRLLEEGYIRGVQEDRPAVIQLNMLIASIAVNEFLARLHLYRIDGNSDYAVVRISLSHGIFDHEPDGEPCKVISRNAGRGDVKPMLDWAELD